MANATATKAASGVQPKRLHAGTQTIRARYIAEASHSATDVIQLVKVPDGAIIDDVVVTPIIGTASAPATTCVFTIGDGDDPNRYLSASYDGVVLRATLGLGYKYDLSDDAADLFDTIDLTITAGTITASQGLDVLVTYHVDD